MSYGSVLCRKQHDLAARDYSYIKYFRKSIMTVPDGSRKDEVLHLIKFHEGLRDYYSASLREVNHLIHIGGLHN